MQLTVAQQGLIRQSIADVLKIDLRSVVVPARLYLDFNVDGPKFDAIKSRIESELSVNLSPALDGVMARVASDDSMLLTKESMNEIVGYLGEWPKIPKKRVSYFVLFTIGMLEAIVSKAFQLGNNEAVGVNVKRNLPIEPTEEVSFPSSQSSDESTIEQVLERDPNSWLDGGPHLAGLSDADQQWWNAIPSKIGMANFRLVLVGMLRQTFLDDGGLDQVATCLNTAEKFAETDSNWDQREAKLRGVKSWKRRVPLWQALIPVLEANLNPLMAGEVLSIVGLSRRWEPGRALDYFKSFYRSIDGEGLQDNVLDEWKTKPVVALCKTMHRTRDFTQMAKLASLLRDAGCAVAPILEHCEDPNCTHIRGDWLVLKLME